MPILARVVFFREIKMVKIRHFCRQFHEKLIEIQMKVIHMRIFGVLNQFHGNSRSNENGLE